MGREESVASATGWVSERLGDVLTGGAVACAWRKPAGCGWLGRCGRSRRRWISKLIISSAAPHPAKEQAESEPKSEKREEGGKDPLREQHQLSRGLG